MLAQVRACVSGHAWAVARLARVPGLAGVNVQVGGYAFPGHFLVEYFAVESVQDHLQSCDF